MASPKKSTPKKSTPKKSTPKPVTDAGAKLKFKTYESPALKVTDYSTPKKAFVAPAKSAAKPAQ